MTGSSRFAALAETTARSERFSLDGGLTWSKPAPLGSLAFGWMRRSGNRVQLTPGVFMDARTAGIAGQLAELNPSWSSRSPTERAEARALLIGTLQKVRERLSLPALDRADVYLSAEPEPWQLPPRLLTSEPFFSKPGVRRWSVETIEAAVVVSASEAIHYGRLICCALCGRFETRPLRSRRRRCTLCYFIRPRDSKRIKKKYANVLNRLWRAQKSGAISESDYRFYLDRVRKTMRSKAAAQSVVAALDRICPVRPAGNPQWRRVASASATRTAADRDGRFSGDELLDERA